MTRSRMLIAAAKKLGIWPQPRRRDLVELAARAMGVDVPERKLAGYQLLKQFCGITEDITIKKSAQSRVWRLKVSSSPVDPRSDDFLRTYEWRRLRMTVLTKRGARCECCGAVPTDGQTVINVDHIQPRRMRPDLALVETNLQVLCNACNHGKGNWDTTDWRVSSAL